MKSVKKSKIAIINGEIFLKNVFVPGSIIIHGNKIKQVLLGKNVPINLNGYKVIDASDCYVSYGFIDPHVHFRCPGAEYKEDWSTGSKAAVKGGYTFVIDMPNNNPPAIDLKSLLAKNKIAKNSPINHGFYLGLTHENAKNINRIYKSCIKKRIPLFGIKVFLGASTGDLLVTKRKAIFNSLKKGLINLFHAEDEEVLKEFSPLKNETVYDHDKKRPAEAEVSAFKKIIRASKQLKKNANIYICHVSSKKLVEIIEKYRKIGFNIIAEVTPHHLYFDLESIASSNVYKVNPPIRHSDDVAVIRQKFNEGFFQIIGTDHAPHLLNEKQSVNPPSGFPGLESSFYALYYLYEKKLINLEMIFKLLNTGYKVFGIKKRGKLKKGNYADITIIKKVQNKFTSVDAVTKANFSPYDGLTCDTKIITVIINGNFVMMDGNFINI